jgi:hypothetical protein
MFFFFGFGWAKPVPRTSTTSMTPQGLDPGFVPYHRHTHFSFFLLFRIFNPLSSVPYALLYHDLDQHHARGFQFNSHPPRWLQDLMGFSSPHSIHPGPSEPYGFLSSSPCST